MKDSVSPIRNRGAALLAIAASLVLCCSSAVFAGEDVPAAKLPEPVTKAIMERFPKAELIKAEKETEKGKVKYEVKIRTEGKEKEVDVSPEGKILEVDDED